MRIALLALAWMLGIAASAHTESDSAAIVAAAGLFAATLFAWRPRFESLVIGALGVLLVFGAALRYEDGVPAEPPLAAVNDGDAVTVRGVVVDGPDPQGTSQVYRVDVDERLNDDAWQPEAGGVLLRAPLYPEFEYGDYVEFTGELATPENFDDFDYRAYLLRRGVSSIVEYPEIALLDDNTGSRYQEFLHDLRNELSDTISRSLPEPEASLASGVLLGAGSDLPYTLRSDLNTTGTSHIVAVSGQNVTIIAVVVIAALTWVIGRRPAAWAALLAIVGYAVLVGLEASVLRATIMGAIWILSIIVGRQNTAWIGIAVAAAIMTAIDPQVVHDVAFQLSFASILALSVLGAPLERIMRKAVKRWPSVESFPGTRAAILLVAMTLASMAFTVPITLLNFQQVSIVAPLANLLAVPAFVAVLGTAAVVAVAGLVSEPLGDIAAFAAWPPAAYMLFVIDAFASIPKAALEITWFRLEYAIAYYVVLAALVYVVNRSAPGVIEPPEPVPLIPRPVRYSPAIAAAVLMAIASTLIWLAAWPQDDTDKLRVTFLDVGQGDAALIETPSGQRVLVDGGPSPEAIESALGRVLPFYDRRIDLVVLTHPQSDHIAGLVSVLEEYDVGAAFAGSSTASTGSYSAWIQALASAETPLYEAYGGQRINFGGGVSIEVLSPARGLEVDDVNAASVVMRLSMGEVSFLLTGDATEETEIALLDSGDPLAAEVLKVGHHGSKTSTSEAFLDEVSPVVDVVSAGAGNSYGHPSGEVLKRLAGDAVLRTDVHGDIMVETDGERLWVSTQKDGDSDE